MAIELKVPQVNTNDQEVEVIQWHVQDAEWVTAGQPLVDVETSKAVVTLESEAEGFIQVQCQEGEILPTGAIFAVLTERLQEAAEAAQEVAAPSVIADGQEVEPGSRSSDRIQGHFGFTRFSGAARDYLEAQGISLDRFENCGLVSLNIAQHLLGHPVFDVAPTEPHGLTSQPETSQGSGVPAPNLRSEKVTKAKALEIQYLSAGQAGNLNSSLTVQFNSQRIRDTLQGFPALEGQVFPLILYELSRLLLKYPALTAYYENEKFWFYDAVHLGLAMDLGKGLKAPVINHVDELEPIAIYDRVKDLAFRYMSNDLAPEELVGGTFTVTDLSSENILYFQPLVNQRQSAILGVGGDGHLPGFPMTLTLVFDHRILAGREVGIFLNELKSRLLSYEMDNFPETAKHQTLDTVVCGRCRVSVRELYEDYQTGAVMYLHMNDNGQQDYICCLCAAMG